ncbi:hypothetical protein Naga_101115g3 [Nannochloropsis gaditana]|uniref:Uncharacterized protein n=1 Tax=Nannochloropsis gaditana TaxID=72520 RepID=W7U2P4_9STRA|nr:hypothetical protein Naga_101115g3 [Nannochloropsis gaditana]
MGREAGHPVAGNVESGREEDEMGECKKEKAMTSTCTHASDVALKRHKPRACAKGLDRSLLYDSIQLHLMPVPRRRHPLPALRPSYPSPCSNHQAVRTPPFPPHPSTRGRWRDARGPSKCVERIGSRPGRQAESLRLPREGGREEGGVRTLLGGVKAMMSLLSPLPPLLAPNLHAS